MENVTKEGGSLITIFFESFVLARECFYRYNFYTGGNRNDDLNLDLDFLGVEFDWDGDGIIYYFGKFSNEYFLRKDISLFMKTLKLLSIRRSLFTLFILVYNILIF